jgi:hypothetical protein
LAAVCVKRETIGEITAAAQVMRESSTKVHVADKTHLVDIVGTAQAIAQCITPIGRWFYVWLQPPQGHEKRGAGAQRVEH